MGIPTGAGAMYSTVGDLHKWNKALYGGKLLSQEHLAEFLTPSPHDAVGDDKYAHGVIISQSDAGKYIWHGGGIQGFNAWLGYDPDKKVTVAVLANLNGGAPTNIGRQLMTLVQGGVVTLPDERAAATITP